MDQTGFEMHGIGHLSASSINLFASAPALWVMERLLKRRGVVGALAHRGTAAEQGVTMGLLDQDAPLAECQAIALDHFDRLTALSGDPKRAKEREAVAPIVATALEALRPYGRPDQVQHRIEVSLPGVPVPFVGFVDFGWSEHGITLDLKTALRLAPEPSAAHSRQVAIYCHNTNREARICYATPSKSAVYRVDNARDHIEAVANIARRMERLLRVSADPMEIASLVVPDYEAFYWSSPVTRAMGREVFGF